MWGLVTGAKDSNLLKVSKVESISNVLNYQWLQRWYVACHHTRKQTVQGGTVLPFSTSSIVFMHLHGSCVTHSLLPCCPYPLWFASAVETGTAESACWWNSHCFHTSLGRLPQQGGWQQLISWRKKKEYLNCLTIAWNNNLIFKNSQTEGDCRTQALVADEWSHLADASS